MREAKKEILKNIRSALGTVPESEQPGDVAVPREYRRQGERSAGECVCLFIERVGEYKASVREVSSQELAGAVAECCSKEKVRRLVVPQGFPKAWIPEGLAIMSDSAEAPLSHHELDHADGVITTSALGVAQTGTIILDAGPGQGRRVLTLLPDVHLCIIRRDQIVELIPEGFAHFDSAIKNEGPPITFISGPSATSDIELSRVEGVHGPRRLTVFVVA